MFAACCLAALACIVTAQDTLTTDEFTEDMSTASRHQEDGWSTVEPVSIQEKPGWQIWLDNSQITISIIGVITNMGTLVTLTVNGQEFAPCISLLLKHQSLIDSAACLVALTQILEPVMWITGVGWMDIIVCQWWHSNAFYWGTLFVSICNLVLVAFERFVCVCLPLRHNELTKKKLIICIICMYVGSVAANWGTPIISFHMVDGNCVPRPQDKSYFLAFAVSAFTTFYALPSISLAIFYGMVIYSLRKRLSDTSRLGSSTVIEKASVQITKAAIALTMIFIVTFSYNLWYFLLGTIGAFDFVVGNFHQAFSQWVTSFNCFINPFVYLALMPAFGRSLKKTCCCCCLNKEGSVTGQSIRKLGRSGLAVSTPELCASSETTEPSEPVNSHI